MKILINNNSIKVREKNFYSNVLGHYESRQKLAHLRTFPIPSYPFFTCNMNNFEKYLFKNEVSFDYHLSGYGSTVEEASMSLMGESAERFAFVSQIKLYDTVFESYNEMKKLGHETIDYDYINIFSVGKIRLDKNQKINWIRMNALKLEAIKYIPAQLVIPNIADEIDNGIRYNLETVSTGTAAQENITEALRSAIYEILQLDSFNMWWYMGYRSRICNCTIEELFLKYNLYDRYDNFFKFYNITINDISFDKNIYVIAVEIESIVEYLPKYTVGLGAGHNLEQTIYRAILECMTIVEYNCNTCWIDEEKYLSVNKNSNFNNLDLNVIYYAKNGKPSMKYKNYLNWNNEKTKSLKEIIDFLPDDSYFYTITPPDFKSLNNEIVRVVVPEMLPMAIPQSPPINHPRYLHTPILNKVIHPLP